MAVFDSYLELANSRRKTSRRIFLIGGAAFSAGYVVFRWWRFRAREVANRLTRFITPTKEFYSVSLFDGFRAGIDQRTWKLELVGYKGNQRKLGYQELCSLESRKIFKTLVCVGNEIGGPLMGNAEWTVTPLALLLRELKSDPEADRVMFYGADGFYSSVPLEIALSEHSYIAYQMNGEPLTDEHGFPARVLLPGRYGMKQPRWLTKIEIVKSPFLKGHWEARGFSDRGRIHPQARIDYAMKDIDGDWLVTGIATAAELRVEKVEVSFDDGRIWEEAAITSERLPDSWCTWKLKWKPRTRGEQILCARVICEGGERQIESNGTAFPSGSTGLHRVRVNVV